MLKADNFRPKDILLTSLREILQTSSPLSNKGFEYVYKAIKDGVHFNSISGALTLMDVLV